MLRKWMHNNGTSGINQDSLRQMTTLKIPWCLHIKKRESFDNVSLDLGHTSCMCVCVCAP